MRTDELKNVFPIEARPASLIASNELSEDERIGIAEIGKFGWDELSIDVLEGNFDAINLMSPEAFVYYLPAVIKLSFENEMRNAITAVAVVSMLDRTPDRTLWDSHFLQRWPRLTVAQISIVEDWVLWLTSAADFALDEVSVIRALETLSLLRSTAPKS